MLLPQLAAPPAASTRAGAVAVLLIASGLVKKTSVADSARASCNDVFGEPGVAAAPRSARASTASRSRSTSTSPATRTWRAASAWLLGFELPPNFDLPYLSAQRGGVLAALAHDAVALAARLPVHPARRQPRGHVRAPCLNLMLTMLLGGLWHGRRWNFVIWGGLPRAAPVCIERAIAGGTSAQEAPLRARDLPRIVLDVPCVCWRGWRFARPRSARS